MYLVFTSYINAKNVVIFVFNILKFTLEEYPWGVYNNTRTGIKGGKQMKANETGNAVPIKHKAIPREDESRRRLQNRLSRISGQLKGISSMLEENRYCGDILIQIAAVESALQAFGYIVLQEHMESCMVERIQEGDLQVIEEAVELIKKLK